MTAPRPQATEVPRGDPLPLLELRCGSIATGGGCVARAPDGRVVFVRHALPGERVLARVTAATSSFLRADATEILEPSADRVVPPCGYSGPGGCGGCDWQHVAPAAQRRLKAELIAEHLRRIAGVDRSVEVEEVPGSPGGLGWRTRVRFAVDRKGNVGLRRHRSHELALVERCLVATPAVEELGVEGLRWPGAVEVEAFAIGPDEPRGEDARASSALVVLVPGRSGIRRRDVPRLPAGSGLVAEDEVLEGPGSLTSVVLSRAFRITAGAFWQVHRGAPSVLGRAVVSGLEPAVGERALDLFAGVGLFSVLIGAAVGPLGAVHAVERDRRASADLRQNSRDLPQVTVRTAPVTADLLERLGSHDLVVLDPPREGAGRALMSSLAAMRPAPRRVAYVSCDAATFARDLAVLFGAGWTMPTLRAFDLFPMTEHVELLAILQPPDIG